MCAIHLTIVRQLNSIYLQAPNIPASENAAFIKYAKSWIDWVSLHHHGEETMFFPDIEKAAKLPGLMKTNVEQHHAFEEGFYKMRDHLDEISKDPTKFNGAELQRMIDKFAPALVTHLHDEISTLASIPEQP